MGTNRAVGLVAALASSVFLMLAVAPSADAALCVRVAVRPANPSVGLAQLDLRTFVPIVDGKGAIQLSSEAVPSYPFQVVAVDPRGRRVPVVVSPSDDDPKLWVGPIMFTDEGAWEIRVTNFEPEGGVGATSDRTSYAPLHVLVLGKGATSTPADLVPSKDQGRAPWAVLVLSLSAAILGAMAVILFRRRLRQRVR